MKKTKLAFSLLMLSILVTAVQGAIPTSATWSVDGFYNPDRIVDAALPVITEGATAAVAMDEDNSPTAFALTLHATDGDGDTLIWSIQTPASHGTAIASGTGASQVMIAIRRACCPDQKKKRVSPWSFDSWQLSLSCS